MKLGGTVATVGFPNQDFMRKPGNQEKEFIHGFLVSLFAFCLSSLFPDQPAGAAGVLADGHRPGGALVDARGNVGHRGGQGAGARPPCAAAALAATGSLPESLRTATK